MTFKVKDGIKIVDNTITSSGGELLLNGSKIWTQANDGNGSGLDADLFDGLGSSSFLRIDSSDIRTEVLTISKDAVYPLVIDSGGVGNNFVGIDFTTDAAKSQRGQFTFSHYDSQSQGAQASFHFNSTEGNTNVIIDGGGDFYVGSDQVWHEGNDGSGSGLDADKLDGYHYTTFAAEVLSYRTSGTNSSGRLKIRLPFTTSSGRMLKFTISQLSGYVQHDYEVSGYLYANTNQWYSSKVIYTGTGTPDIILGRDADGRAYVSIADGAYTGLSVHSLVVGYSGSLADTYNTDWSVAQDSTTPDSTSVTVDKVWHSGNDGSGSGLDADLLDGASSSSYGKLANNQTWTGTNEFSTKVELQGNAAVYGGTGYGIFSGYSSNDNHFIAVRAAVSGSNTSPSITGGHQTTFVEYAENNDTTGWYFKSSQTGTYAEVARITRTGGMHLNGNKVWHQGNDGSGSGLDADLLDGQDGGYYAPRGGFTGNMELASVSTSSTAYGDAGLEIREGGKGGSGAAAPRIAMHWGGRVASNISMESSGAITIRNNPGSGYEDFKANNIYASGNVTAYSDIRVKDNLKIIPDALSKISKINGYTYDRTDIKPDEFKTEYESIHNPKNRHVGLVAQELLEILPEAVTGGPTSEDGTEEEHYAVAYGNVIALLVEGIKEQQETIASMQNDINTLKNNNKK
jgi:hypothetical protein